jgi:hypothetical protein
MKVGVLCAAMMTAFVMVVPASAQVAIRDRDDVIIRDHDRGWHRNRGWYRHHAECRTVRVRKHLPNGKVVIKTRRTC